MFVVCGDGECDEGSVWEAALCAAKHRLSNLVVLIDYNKQQSYGTTWEVLDLEPLADKWRAFGFAVAEVDGHPSPSCRPRCCAFRWTADRPSAIICHTIKGKGVGFVENNLNWHHKNRASKEEIESLLAALESD